MIKSLEIQNFRIYRDFRLDGLERVNLIVGKNNTGKTCLIEALQVYAANGDTSVLNELITARDGGWEEEILAETRVEDEPPNLVRYRDLFHGRRVPRPGSTGFRIAATGDEPGSVRMATSYAKQSSNEGIPRRSIIEPEDVDPSDLSTEVISLLYLETGAAPFVRVLPTNARRLRSAFVGTELRRMPCYAVPSGGLTNANLGTLWDGVNLTDKVDEVLKALSEIIPGVDGLAFLTEAGDRSRPNRYPIVRMAGSEERLPLRGMGDGTARVFQLSLALVNAKNGLLLIDEFENGLHWSLHSSLWTMIFRVAQELNAQVFATTHSRDCIEGFRVAWHKYRSQGAFFRLESPRVDEITAYTYDADTLSDAIDAEVKVL